MIAYIKAGAIAIGAAAVLWVYVYVNDMRDELDLRIAENAQSKLVISELKGSIGGILENLEEADASLKRIEISRKKSKEKLDKLEETIHKHDIAKIRTRKPELLRRIYERGTNKYYKEIENVMEN
jgi:rRNA-processing protein FCF1